MATEKPQARALAIWDSVTGGMVGSRPSLEKLVSRHARQHPADLFRWWNMVVVVGAGGTGHWFARLLAMTGLTQSLVIIDGDTIKQENRNRLEVPLEAIGVNKAVYTAGMIAATLPDDHLEIVVEPREVMPEEVLSMVETAMRKPPNVHTAAIVSCVDSFEFQVALFDAIKKSEFFQRALAQHSFTALRCNYNGLTEVTISDGVSKWGTPIGRYEIIPSLALPAVLAAVWGVYTLGARFGAPLDRFIATPLVKIESEGVRYDGRLVAVGEATAKTDRKKGWAR